LHTRGSSSFEIVRRFAQDGVQDVGRIDDATRDFRHIRPVHFCLVVQVMPREL
jgi:hypothetical protein